MSVYLFFNQECFDQISDFDQVNCSEYIKLDFDLEQNVCNPVETFEKKTGVEFSLENLVLSILMIGGKILQHLQIHEVKEE